MDKEKNEVINILKDFKVSISKLISVGKLILFGSRARGDNKKNSDIDILIISDNFEGKKSFKRASELYMKWNWNNNYEVDIICLTPEEFETKRKQIGTIRDVIKEGIEI